MNSEGSGGYACNKLVLYRILELKQTKILYRINYKQNEN